MLEFQKFSNYSKITYILCHLGLVIAIIGILGNFVSFLVFGGRRFKKCSFVLYFKIICISDSIVLFHLFVHYLEHVIESKVFYVSSIGCKFGRYFLTVFASISVWLLLLISLDRLRKMVIQLQKFNFFHKPCFQISIVVFIVAFNLIIPIGVPLKTQLINTTKFDNLTNSSRTELMCDSDEKRYKSRLLCLIISSVVFFLLNIVTVINVCILFKSRRNLNSLKSTRANEPLSIQDQNRKNRDRKYAIISITLNCVCFLCKIPLSMVAIIFSRHENKDLFKMIEAITFVVFSLDNACMFFVNMSVNSIFKEQFMGMFFNKPKYNRPNVQFNHI